MTIATCCNSSLLTVHSFSFISNGEENTAALSDPIVVKKPLGQYWIIFSDMLSVSFEGTAWSRPSFWHFFFCPFYMTVPVSANNVTPTPIIPAVTMSSSVVLTKATTPMCYYVTACSNPLPPAPPHTMYPSLKMREKFHKQDSPEERVRSMT